MAEVWITEHPDGSWWASGAREGEVIDGWEGLALMVEEGLTLRWDSPEATEKFTAYFGSPDEI